MTGGRRTTSRAPRIGVQDGDNDLPPGRAAQDGGRSSWIDVHTDQAIIFGSLTLGLWLIAKDIYLIVS